MNKKYDVKLVCKSTWYYSPCDEELFFAWIEKIKSIIGCEGLGDELYLYFKSAHMSDDDLRELIALFYRYKVDMKQLQIFLNDENKEWFFGRPKGYWHKKVFGIIDEQK